jgi:hypothetical protein
MDFTRYSLPVLPLKYGWKYNYVVAKSLALESHAVGAMYLDDKGIIYSVTFVNDSLRTNNPFASLVLKPQIPTIYFCFNHSISPNSEMLL